MAFVYSALSVLLVYAAVIDIRDQRIPNLLCLLILTMGIVANSLLATGSGIYSCLSGLCAGFLPMFFLHLLTGLGAGDVKLMAAVGSVVGMKSVLIIFCYSFALSGLLALAYIAFGGGLKDMLRRYGLFLNGLLKGRVIFNKPAANTMPGLQMPMAPGIALATTYVLLPSISSALLSVQSIGS